MNIKTITFGELTQSAFNTSVGYFKRVAKTMVKHFEIGVIYGVAAVFETGDYAHINKLLPALTLAGLEPKFRRTVVAHKVVPFKYDHDSCQYIGKIFPGTRASLELIDAKTGIPQWEKVLRAALDGELPENKTTPAWKLETRLASLLKKAVEEGYTAKDIRKQFTRDMRELVKSGLVPAVVESKVPSGDAQALAITARDENDDNADKAAARKAA